MSNSSIGLTEEVHAYLLSVGVREPEVLRRLREETAQLPNSSMQIAPEEGAALAMLVRLIGARRILEIGTFTGYSSTAMALALPADGRMVCCDVSEEWTDMARTAWAAAGVADRIELHLAPTPWHRHPRRPAPPKTACARRRRGPSTWPSSIADNDRCHAAGRRRPHGGPHPLGGLGRGPAAPRALPEACRQEAAAARPATRSAIGRAGVVG